MKKKDIGLIAVVVIISGVISLVLSNILIGSPKSKPQEVEVVEAITEEFGTPDTKYFNATSKNFTQTITIGDNPNPQPFNE